MTQGGWLMLVQTHVPGSSRRNIYVVDVCMRLFVLRRIQYVLLAETFIDMIWRVVSGVALFNGESVKTHAHVKCILYTYLCMYAKDI